METKKLKVSKREVLTIFAKYGNCLSNTHLNCSDCSYQMNGCGQGYQALLYRLARIGAMSILRKHRKARKFNPNRILTCVTADQAKVGMRGYFADNIESLRYCFRKKQVRELLEVYGEKSLYCFKGGHQDFALFYPLEEGDEYNV